MPLIPSKSKQAIAQNIKTEMAAGKPQKQAIAIAYNVKKASGGPVMSDSKMMNALMRKRKAKMMAEGGEVYDYDLMDQDETPAKHERPDNAKMNNTEPDLREQSRVDMGDNEDSVLDHKLSAEGNEAERENALYADGGPVIDPDKAQSAQDSMRKAFKFKDGGIAYNANLKENEGEDAPMEHNEDDTDHSEIPRPASGYAKGGKVSSGPHAEKSIAYGHGLSESEQQDEPRLSDEDSEIAMAEGGIAYNLDMKEHEKDDTAELTDEDSHLAYAEGGSVEHATSLKPDDEDTKESKDEASSITMALGGSVEHAASLQPDDEDTPESHDEDSHIAMASGGQIEDDQSSHMNPKSMQNEAHQEHAMKLRRRKLMIQALND